MKTYALSEAGRRAGLRTLKVKYERWPTPNYRKGNLNNYCEPLIKNWLGAKLNVHRILGTLSFDV